MMMCLRPMSKVDEICGTKEMTIQTDTAVIFAEFIHRKFQTNSFLFDSPMRSDNKSNPNRKKDL